MEDGNNRFFGFGDFRVDARRRILSKNGETISLSPRNFDLLLVMIENEGQILSHDDLLDRVWEGTFVEQANLKNAISVLRRVLGEQANEALYIRTVPRRGYSFVAPVEVLPDESSTTSFTYEETISEIVVEEEIESDDDPAATLVDASRRQLPEPVASSSWNFGKMLALVGVVVILAGVGYGIWRWSANNSGRLTLDNIKITKLTNKGNLNGAVVSPSGSYFLFASVEPDGTTLFAQQIATGIATKLTEKQKSSFWYFAFSPDENYVYYSVNNNVDAAQNGFFKVALFGGAPQRLSDNSTGFVPSPDASRILFPRPLDGKTQFINANPDYSDEKVVAVFGPESRIWSNQWSPDGLGVLFAVRKFEGEKILHYVIEFPVSGGGEGRVIVPDMEKQITSAVWLPGKTSVLMSLREINAEVRQIWQYTVANGELRRVTNDDNSYRGLSISRDGKTVTTTTENVFASVMTADDDKFNFKQVTSGTSRLGSISATGDGRFVYSITSNGVESLSIMDADGANSRQITNGTDGIWLAPRVASNGKSVAFASLRSSKKQLVRIDLDGRNLTQLTNGDFQVFRGQILLDDKTIVFEGVGPDHQNSLFRQAADGTLTKLIEKGVDDWDISPDEKFLAYSATDPATNQHKVYIKTLDSGWLYKVLDINPTSQLRWTRDGRSLTYNAINGESSELRMIPLEGGESKLLTSFQGEQIFSFDWSFDGKRISLVRGKPLADAVQISLGN